MHRIFTLLAVSITFNTLVSSQDIYVTKDSTIQAGTDTIKGNITVNENVTLTILPGAVIYFQQAACSGCAYSLIVKGRIIAKGKAGNPILFTSKPDYVSSGFKKVSIEKATSNTDTAIFEYCIFDYSHWEEKGAIFINENSKAKFSNCIIGNGDYWGITNRGFISITNSSIYNNSNGGINNSGIAKVMNTSIYKNYGSGIYNHGNLLVINCTIDSNHAPDGQKGTQGTMGTCTCYTSNPGGMGGDGGNGGNGGGIYNDSIAEIINATITRNKTGKGGAGGNGGTAGAGLCSKYNPVTSSYTYTSCFSSPGIKGFDGNPGKGGGIFNSTSGTLKLKNSIVAYNAKPDNTSDEVFGPLTTSNYNIIKQKTNITFTTDSIGNKFVSPLADTIKSNGGYTVTCALQKESPAINAIPQNAANVPVSDQRNFIRLDNPDIGAFEYGAAKFKTSLFDTICEGKSILNHTATGSYISNLKTYDGWDSVVVLNLTVKPLPTIINSSGGSHCGTGTVSLGATASAGTINWYAASTGGSSLGTGTSYNTPALTSTTVYYIDATNNGCTTASRTAVTATINTTPIITGKTDASRCGTGTVNLGATASAGTINWYAASTGGSSLGTGTDYKTPELTSSTVYYVDATNNGCTSALRTEVTATINTTPTITGKTDASRCGTGTVSLGATASAGTINWYAASTGGTSLGTGTSYTTPELTSTTVYYVDATNNGCTTVSRTAVNANFTCNQVNSKSFSDLIRVFPNPTKNIIEISLDKSLINNIKIELYSDLGCLLNTLSINKNENSLQMDLSNHSAGVYFLKFYTKNGISRYKIIKE